MHLQSQLNDLDDGVVGTRQLGEDLVEDAEATPAHEPVIDRLVRAIAWRHITPAQTIPDNENDAADHPSIVNGAIPCDNGKYGSIRRICASDSNNKSAMAMPPDTSIESIDHRSSKEFNGS
jgi:hypothetical protein